MEHRPKKTSLERSLHKTGTTHLQPSDSQCKKIPPHNRLTKYAHCQNIHNKILAKTHRVLRRTVNTENQPTLSRAQNKRVRDFFSKGQSKSRHKATFIALHFHKKHAMIIMKNRTLKIHCVLQFSQKATRHIRKEYPT